MVEDEDDVRKVLYQLLHRAGHDVTTAADGASAEQAFRQQGPFDLLLSDIVMPGDLQGPDLALGLRQLDPGLKVIFLSGYPNEATVHGNGLREADVRLMKPVSRARLLAEIDRVLAL